MSRQFKNLPYFEIKAADDASGSRVRKGICAVFGNVDSWGDRILNGAFAKTIAEGRDRVKHLWNHSFSEVPIAKIVELKEIGREELPLEVLEYAPEATGGLLVAREYLNSEKANAVLEAMDAGVITEMSFGYDVLKSAESEEEDRKIRNLVELKLFDTSDVIWGMNAATVAAGAKHDLPLSLIVSNLIGYADEVKAGRRNAAADMELIRGIHGALTDLGYADCMPKEEPKSDEPEPLQLSTSLDLLKLKHDMLKLRAETLTI